MMVVTTNDVPGYRVTAVLGEVMGLTVRSLNIGTSFTAGLRSIGGGEITEYTRIMYESRQEVMHRMTIDAQNRGANAILMMRFDAGSVNQFSEVCAYGTAVVIEPIAAGEPRATPQSAAEAVPAPAEPPYPYRGS